MGSKQVPTETLGVFAKPEALLFLPRVAIGDLIDD